MSTLRRALRWLSACAWLAACASTVPETAVAPVPVAEVEATPASARPAWTLAFDPIDTEVARELEPVLAAAVADVERFFGAPFASPFDVRIDPERAAFDASFPPKWGIERTECWMVASGVAARLELLSPRVWRTEACEHDPADARHVRELVAHELVHVYHGQHNPSPDFAEVTGIDWFVEGLATHASGQLASGELASAREALEKDAGPRGLGDAWKGKYRYGVSGSLVAFVEHELGREALVGLLDATTGEDLLARIGRSEGELLDGWAGWVLGSP